MADKKYSANDVVKLWSEGKAHDDQYEIQEHETVDGPETWLVDRYAGSLSASVDGTGEAALRKLAENVNSPFIDGAASPVVAVEDEKQLKTEKGVKQTPTQPEVLKTAEGLGDIDPADLNPGVAQASSEDTKAKK